MLEGMDVLEGVSGGTGKDKTTAPVSVYIVYADSFNRTPRITFSNIVR